MTSRSTSALPLTVNLAGVACFGGQAGGADQFQGDRLVQAGFGVPAANDEIRCALVVLAVDELVEPDPPGQPGRFVRRDVAARSTALHPDRRRVPVDRSPCRVEFPLSLMPTFSKTVPSTVTVALIHSLSPLATKVAIIAW